MPSALVGREEELQQLHDLIASSSALPFPLVLLTGAEGIGKTTILRVFCESHAGVAPVVLEACLENDDSYSPWGKILSRLLGQCSDTLVQPLQATLAVLAATFVEIRDKNPNLPALRPVEWAGVRVFDSVRNVISTIAQSSSGGLLIAIDGLHLAGPDFLRMLEHVVGSAAGTRVTVLATCDVPLPDTNHREQLDRLIRRARDVPVEPLSKDEVTRRIAALDPTREYTPSAVHWIFSRSGGNPLLVATYRKELVDAGYDANDRKWWGTSAYEQLPIAKEHRRFIENKLDLLQEDVMQALKFAAILDDPFDSTELARLSGRDVAETARLLDVAISLCVVGREGDEACFFLPESKAAVIRRIGMLEQKQIAQEIAQKLEQAPRTTRDRTLRALRCRKLASPEDPSLIDRAIDAAKALSDGNAYEDAQCCLEIGVEVARAIQNPRLCRLKIGLGNIRSVLGDTLGAKALLLEAGKLATQADDDNAVVDAALGCGTGFYEVPIGLVHEGWVGLLERALELLGNSSPEKRSRLMGRISQEIYYDASRYERRLELSSLALGLARTLPDTPEGKRTRFLALQSRRNAIWAPGDQTEGSAIAKEMLTIANDLDDPEFQALSLLWLLIGALGAGRLKKAGQHLRKYQAICEELAHPHLLWQAEMTSAMFAVLRGDLVEGMRLARVALGYRKVLTTHLDVEQLFVAQLLWIRRLEGKPDDPELQGFFGDLMGELQGSSVWEVAGAELYARQGVHEPGQDLLEQYRRGERKIEHDLNEPLVLWGLAEICLKLKDKAAAKWLYPRLDALGDDYIVVQPAVACLGSIRAVCGRVATLNGELDQAISDLRRALRSYRDSGSLSLKANIGSSLAKKKKSNGPLALKAEAQLALADVHFRKESSRAWTKKKQRPQGRKKTANRSEPSPRKTRRVRTAFLLLRSAGKHCSPFVAADVERLQVAKMEQHATGWKITWGGVSKEFPQRGKRDVKFSQLAVLLKNEGKDLWGRQIISLASTVSGTERVMDVELMQARLEDEDSPDADHEIAEWQAIDESTLAVLEGMKADIEKAMSEGDFGQAEVLRREHAQLERAVDPRTLQPETEKSRQSVSKNIASAVKLIATKMPGLARHLDYYVLRGKVCRYAMPDWHPSWEIAGREEVRRPTGSRPRRNRRKSTR